MSRLFTRLENIGQEGSDKDTQPLPEAQGAAGPQADAGQPALPVQPASAAPLPPLVPGYASAPNLSSAAPPPATRPVWTVRLWFSSLVLLVALSLLMLFLPRQQLSAPQRPTAAVENQPVLVTPAPPESAPVIAPARPAASAPAPRPIARTEAEPATAPVRPAAPTRTTAPAAGAASCTEAMLALNLCATPSP